MTAADLSGRSVSLTVDVEPDCPPYLDTYRGVDEGLPRLVDLLAEAGVRATFFFTGEVARRRPAAVARALAGGHEVGCHGDSHRPFAGMDAREARREVEEACRTLRAHAPVVSFRAPYLRLPVRHLPLLVEAGFRVDSSGARYKGARAPHRVGPLVRVPASMTSSALRLPTVLRETLLRLLPSPVVLFVHPWELVDLRGERLRLDCRFRTGEAAARGLRATLRSFVRRGFTFARLDEHAR